MDTCLRIMLMVGEPHPTRRLWLSQHYTAARAHTRTHATPQYLGTFCVFFPSFIPCFLRRRVFLFSVLSNPSNIARTTRPDPRLDHPANPQRKNGFKIILYLPIVFFFFLSFPRNTNRQPSPSTGGPHQSPVEKRKCRAEPVAVTSHAPPPLPENRGQQ